jgi:cation diffusion facilitator family transporter
MRNKENAAQAMEIKSLPYLKVGIYSLAVNVALAGAKLVLSFLTRSLALRADAIHSSVDIFGSVALIIGLVIANRKSSKFPYGLYKVENVVTVIISVLLFVSVYEIIIEAIRGETEAERLGGWVLAAVSALALVPYLFSRYEIRAGKKYNSPSLIAEGKQFRADVLSASVVLFALLAQYFGVPLDRIAAGIVAIFIAYAGWGLLSSSMRVLLDASVDSETLSQIHSIIETEPAVISIKDITGRNSGRYIFIEATVTLRVSDLAKAHRISQRIENKIKETRCCVDRVLIHYEPETKTQLRYAVPLSNSRGAIGQHFGESPFFGLIDIDTRTNLVIKQETLANPYLDLKKGKGIKVAQFLLSHKPDIVVTKEDLTGKGPGYAFADAGVQTLQTETQTVDELVEQLLAGTTLPRIH